MTMELFGLMKCSSFKSKSNWQANSLLQFPGLPGFHISITLHCRWPVIICSTAPSVPTQGHRESPFSWSLPTSPPRDWSKAAWHWGVGASTRSYLGWRNLRMPLPCHLNSTPVHRKRNCRCVTAEGWNSPQTYTPPRQEILSCSFMCPDCLKQYLHIVSGQYLFAKWVNNGSILLKHWLASPGSSKRKTLETFLVKLRPEVLNQDVITTAELWVGCELIPRGSK